MIILGIETTCDETGAALVKDGRSIIGNVVVSSAELHKKFGGIVPEVAAREQISAIIPAVKEALDFHTSPLISSIDAIAVAHGPGLIGSLLIGVETAKTLALVWNKPLIAVNHLTGHVYANWLVNEKVSKVPNVSKVPQAVEQKKPGAPDIPNFPLVALVASGAHTDLILMTGHNRFRWLGGSLDDAAGEAFDKVARVLGLGYPGGPQIERAAQQLTHAPFGAGQASDNSQLTFHFPRPLINNDDFDFSFSGLKTAVVNHVSQLSNVKGQVSAIAFEFQNAVCDVLVTKTIRAARKFNARSIIVGGGVAANSELGHRMSDIGEKYRIQVFFPPAHLAVDNGAMIAAAAFFTKSYVYPQKLSANPNLHF